MKFIIVLAALIFWTNTFATCDTLLIPDPARIISRVEFIKSKMNQPLQKKLLYKNSEGMEVLEVLGVPKGASWIEVTNRTFRHYSDHAEEIAQTKILKSGLVPYIVIHPGVRREIYTEMTGAFVTDPGVSPSKVGLGNHHYPYVDLRLKPDTPLLKVEDGIYFIPTPPTMPRWLADKFNHFLETGKLPINPTEQEAIMKLKAVGATTESTKIPIDWTQLNP